MNQITTKKNVIIRVDASPEIGMGHIMRCITIAFELRKKGLEVLFVSANAYGYEVINKHGFETIALKTDYRDMLSEIAIFKQIQEVRNSVFIIVDSYFANDEYLSKLEEIAPTMYLDGLYKARSNITAILNYNAAACLKEYQSRFQFTKTKLLIGTEYVPVREQFANNRKTEVRKHASEVLITTGATDLACAVPQICEEFIKRNLDDINLNVVVGNLFKDRDEIIEITREACNIKVYEGLTDLQPLMAKCDVAISAAGTTVYELLAMGIPSMVFSMVNIQNTVRSLEPSIIWIGDIRDCKDKCSEIKAGELLDILVDLLADYSKRVLLNKRAVSRIDGLGALRISNEVVKIIDNHC